MSLFPGSWSGDGRANQSRKSPCRDRESERTRERERERALRTDDNGRQRPAASVRHTCITPDSVAARSPCLTIMLQNCWHWRTMIGIYQSRPGECSTPAMAAMLSIWLMELPVTGDLLIMMTNDWGTNERVRSGLETFLHQEIYDIHTDHRNVFNLSSYSFLCSSA